jgi:hypothetical protein
MSDSRKHHRLEYNSWVQMKYRCLSPKSKAWPDYGGRGIAVCRRWVESFDDFLADMGTRPSPKHTIHRINNDGNYEPGNCCWATALEHAKNKRPRGKNRATTSPLRYWDIVHAIRGARDAGIENPTVAICLPNGTELTIGDCV